MPTPTPLCRSAITWLRANLGRSALAALTGTDHRALAAAVHILELSAGDPQAPVLTSFCTVVMCMQESTRYIAYHAIAMVLDWHLRDCVWQAAGLEPIQIPQRCEHEPRGS